MTRAAHTKTRCAAWIAVMEELPILSDKERAEMVASLKAAEVRIAAGHYVDHNSTTFVDRLMHVRAAAILSNKA